MKARIVNMAGKRSVKNPSMTYGKGFAIYVDDAGFLSLDGKNIYIPWGGRAALKTIISNGLDNPSYSFISP